uniref:Uncharacterized threonine-rich GPI-anchored glycoprotein PJ4664.02-like n=1 Tax=Saccoglossus kowalevskii TaxID=10224 RepID=A0ABM0M4L2_SACKO|nr:PREDICTED: uncharacterized threonine-rich GPI-anchored glycoprotein PJ4664.02-like [Saccoglossus kowalevskii]
MSSSHQISKNIRGDERVFLKRMFHGDHVDLTGNLSVARESPVLSFIPTDYQVSEWDETVEIILERSGSLNETIDVYLSTLSLSATDTDYEEIDQIVTFFQADTHISIVINLLDDNNVEPTEIFQVKIMSVTIGVILINDSATIIILDDDGISIIGFAPSEYDVIEGDGSVEIYLQRTCNWASIVNVTVSTASLTAIGASDYVESQQSVTFHQGESTASVLISITDDNINEATELFQAVLSFISIRATLGCQVATITVIDDDGPTVVSFNPTKYEVREGDSTVRLILERSGNLADDVELTVDTNPMTASENSDYVITKTAVLLLAQGVTSTSIPIDIVEDREVEDSETFQVKIASATTGVILIDDVAIVTIIDNDEYPAVGFNPTDYTVTEDAGTVEVTLQRSVNLLDIVDVTIDTIALTASGSDDYEDTRHHLTFFERDTSVSIAINIIDDVIQESTDIFLVKIAFVTLGATLTNDVATITILDDDGDTNTHTTTLNPNQSITPSSIPEQATISFNPVEYEVTEADKSVNIILERAGTFETIDVSLSTISVTATEPSDFSHMQKTLTFFPEDASVYVKIDIADDAVFEETELFRIAITYATSGVLILNDVATVTIKDDDGKKLTNTMSGEKSSAGPAIISFNRTAHLVNEGDGKLVVTLERSGNLKNTIEVTLSTHSITAGSPDDYTDYQGLVLFLPWETLVHVVINIADDVYNEATEVFQLTLAVDCCNATIFNNVTTITITDDDGLALVSFNPRIYTVNENAGVVSIIIERTGNQMLALIVELTTNDITAIGGNDYQSLATNVTFAAGQTTHVISIQITNDELNENDETFDINASIFENTESTVVYSTATVTIINNANSTLNISRPQTSQLPIFEDLETDGTAASTMKPSIYMPPTAIVPYTSTQASTDIILPISDSITTKVSSTSTQILNSPTSEIAAIHGDDTPMSKLTNEPVIMDTSTSPYSTTYSVDTTTPISNSVTTEVTSIDEENTPISKLTIEPVSMETSASPNSKAESVETITLILNSLTTEETSIDEENTPTSRLTIEPVTTKTSTSPNTTTERLDTTTSKSNSPTTEITYIDNEDTLISKRTTEPVTMRASSSADSTIDNVDTTTSIWNPPTTKVTSIDEEDKPMSKLTIRPVTMKSSTSPNSTKESVVTTTLTLNSLTTDVASVDKEEKPTSKAIIDPVIMETSILPHSKTDNVDTNMSILNSPSTEVTSMNEEDKPISKLTIAPVTMETSTSSNKTTERLDTITSKSNSLVTDLASLNEKDTPISKPTIEPVTTKTSTLFNTTEDSADTTTFKSNLLVTDLAFIDEEHTHISKLTIEPVTMETTMSPNSTDNTSTSLNTTTVSVDTIISQSHSLTTEVTSIDEEVIPISKLTIEPVTMKVSTSPNSTKDSLDTTTTILNSPTTEVTSIDEEYTVISKRTFAPVTIKVSTSSNSTTDSVDTTTLIFNSITTEVTSVDEKDTPTSKLTAGPVTMKSSTSPNSIKESVVTTTLILNSLTNDVVSVDRDETPTSKPIIDPVIMETAISPHSTTDNNVDTTTSILNSATTEVTSMDEKDKPISKLTIEPVIMETSTSSNTTTERLDTTTSKSNLLVTDLASLDEENTSKSNLTIEPVTIETSTSPNSSADSADTTASKSNLLFTDLASIDEEHTHIYKLTIEPVTMETSASPNSRTYSVDTTTAKLNSPTIDLAFRDDEDTPISKLTIEPVTIEKSTSPNSIIDNVDTTTSIMNSPLTEVKSIDVVDTPVFKLTSEPVTMKSSTPSNSKTDSVDTTTSILNSLTTDVALVDEEETSTSKLIIDQATMETSMSPNSTTDNVGPNISISGLQTTESASIDKETSISKLTIEPVTMESQHHLTQKQ